VIVKKSQLAIVCSDFLIILLFCGCSTLSHTKQDVNPMHTFPTAEVDMAPFQDDELGLSLSKDALRVSAERYRSLALAYEKDHQLYKADFMWRVAQKFDPDDSHAEQRVKALERQIRSESDKHVSKGIDLAKQNTPLSAHNEFLMALAYNPNQKDALELLRGETAASGYAIYETKQGDTMKKVAQKVYSDPEKDFLVAYFGNLNDDADIKPGMALKLPVLESEVDPKPRRVVQSAPPRIQRVSNKADAEEHYRKGVSFFLAEDMQRAIREWEEVLSLDPDHPNARRNIEKARNLLRKRQLK
jgi:tetratricopeptide (TPR) repeat protein